MDEFPNIVPSVFGTFTSHHRGLLACVSCVCIFLKRVLKVYIHIYLYIYGVYSSIYLRVAL